MVLEERDYMKTIQQVLIEMDHKAIEKAYSVEYPVELWELNDYEDVTIGELRRRFSERFQAFLERLCNMEIESNPEKPGILFAHKCLNDENFGKSSLVYLEDLLKEDDLSKVPRYAYEFTEQKKALGFFVAETKYTQDNLMDVVVEFLHEISFFGYDQERLGQALSDIEKSKKELEAGHWISSDELWEELGLPKEEVYPKEDEIKRKYYEAECEYSMYCVQMELEKLKEILRGDSSTCG